MKHLLCISVVYLALSCNVISQNTQSEAINMAKLMQTESFFRHLNFLAGDSLEGRGTGSAGYVAAAGYIEQNIEKLGLRPGGTNGTCFQPIHFEKRTINTASVRFRLSAGNETLEGKFGDDIALLPTGKSTKVEFDQEIVFAGYGLVIPELGINDFEGLDVKGKIVIIDYEIPKTLDKKKYSKFSNPVERIRILEKKGASGVLFYSGRKLLQNYVFNTMQKAGKNPYFDFKDADISYVRLGFGSKPLMYAKKDFVEDIFKLNGLDFKQAVKTMKEGRFRPVALKSRLKVSYSTTNEDIICKNVVAILPGSDAILSSQYVVISAHLDGLGIGKAIKKDSIYNGAYDNASGSATLLTLAEAFKHMPQAPKRSIVFLWVTAEEKGMWGSQYFAQKPTIPANGIFANVNLDCPGGILLAKDFIAMGSKMSTLSQSVDFAAAALDLKADTASIIEERYFEISDHFSFIKSGVPSLYIFGGLDAVDPKTDGLKTYLKWQKELYHSPFDDLNQDIRREVMLQGMQVCFLISWYIANEMKDVKWNTESEQYVRYVGK